ncbi:MAG: aspartate:alanine exchanger family transporter [Planctomycetota bacterium]|jgi:putative transport protein
MSDAAEQLLVLCSVVGLGLVLGRVSWRGVSLGSSGVIFIALAAGHFGFEVSRLVGSAGLVLFVYCLGIGAGPGFTRTILSQGKALLVLAFVMVATAGATAWLVAWLAGLSRGLAAGLLAGAMSSTPGLAAATEVLPADGEIAVGFGVAYPFGVIGVILFVRIAPRFFRQTDAHDLGESGNATIERQLVHVLNPAIVGRRIRDVPAISHANCQVSRILIDGELKPVPSDFQLAEGQRLLLVGTAECLQQVIDVVGRRCDDAGFVLEVEHHRRRVVVTSPEFVGRTIEQLHLLSRFGVTISRIQRHDIEFVPSPRERIQPGDALTAVGEPEALDRFVASAGHRERRLDETDLISLAVGLSAGILLGHVQVGAGGNSFSLGLAGGPLLVGLVLGQLGNVGRIVGHIPRAARLLLAELGLTVFLAQAGVQAGQVLVPVVHEHGLILCMAAIFIVLAPLLTGTLVARCGFQLGSLEACGGMCGAMTSTPGLGAVTSATDSSRPLTSYGTVYPVALILITVMTSLLIVLIQ